MQAAQAIGWIDGWTEVHLRWLQAEEAMRRHGKRDRNHADIVGWYRELGASVVDLGDCGDGVPDLAVGIDRQTDFVEIKYGNGKLTSDQEKFVASWKGSPVMIVRTHFDVVHHVGQMRIRAK